MNGYLQGFCLPLIATASTSAELDNPLQYPYFLRTCASDHYHAHLLCGILTQMNWTRVTVSALEASLTFFFAFQVVYENDAFGYGLKTSFERVRSLKYNGDDG